MKGLNINNDDLLKTIWKNKGKKKMKTRDFAQLGTLPFGQEHYTCIL